MHLYFHHVRVSALNRKDDQNNIDANVKTNQIDNDGIVHLRNGVKLELFLCRLIPPESNEYVNVIMMFSLENMYNPMTKCPNCDSTIPWDRPILLMGNMQFVYPCSDCEWVWKRQSFNMRKFRSQNS